MNAVAFYVADKPIEIGLKTLFQRPDWPTVLDCGRFEINPYNEEDIFRVPGYTDGGVWKHAATNLANHFGRYERAVVILDQHFDPFFDAAKIRADITENMLAAGWPEGSFEVIVIQPMLESWLWTEDTTTASAFGVPDFSALKTQLVTEGLWDPGNPKPKPDKMKDARDRAIAIGGRLTKAIVFSTVFGYLSKRALDLCTEPGFLLLRQTLQGWFPKQATAAEGGVA